ncbi:MAG: LytTR family DNA-binding domain-containing protein [Defluviitaleaceae bacterium]|nr:LytTR family DNA-binding domain-containing protein [Defluviitaleaceae bacterium]
MNYRIAICDNEPAQVDYVTQTTKKWAESHNHQVKITTFESAESFLFEYSEDRAYDILLLDIEMGAMNGVELARAIRAKNKESQIIFITGYMDYISDGYDVEALHYLLKPLREDKFFDTLNRATTKLSQNERVLLLKLADESVRVPLYEIRYIEVVRNYVTIHTTEEYTIKSTLGVLEQELDDIFFRVGRSFIVNLRFIKKVTKQDIFLTDGRTIPMPRGAYDSVNRAIIERL